MNTMPFFARPKSVQFRWLLLFLIPLLSLSVLSKQSMDNGESVSLSLPSISAPPHTTAATEEFDAGENAPVMEAAGPTPIPWSELGAHASKQATGETLAVKMLDDGGALLETRFQRLKANVDPAQGLLLYSTRDEDEGARGEPLRVVADAVGRAGGKAADISRHGMVSVAGDYVRWQRPGLVEEFSVSVDGLRQDFLLEMPPSGSGELRLELAVTGARAQQADYGARLQLDTGRTLAYSRLHVEDAGGQVLPARMEVTTADRIVLAVNDTDAVYPLRIDPTFSDANWISMGGLLGTNSAVLASVVDPQGHLYVGGWFTEAGGTAANRIARWDGSSWSSLGGGVNDTVNALALDSAGHLYAGGDFTTAGGAAANRIARWDGSSWSALGSGVNSTVYALALDGAGNLYAGGWFSTAGGAAANHIAHWDGNNWSPLGSGVNNAVYALALDGAGDLYAGGDFTTAGSATANHIARWDGSNWSPLGSGMNSAVGALALDAAGDLYAGGLFTMAGGAAANYIARWNGSSWSSLGSGMNGWVLALALDGEGHLYAGGDFTTAGGATANRIARWDGGSWSPLGSGMNGSVRALALDGDGNLYAGGWFSTAGDESVRHTARWDGSSWSPVGSGINNRVYALALDDAGTLYAGGEFTTAGGTAANRIVHWDGSNWSPLGSGMNGMVWALALDGAGHLYAGGLFTMAGGEAANRIARWDGSSWSPLGSGMNNTVYALALDDTGHLYAGGDFTTAGGSAANYIARWDGSSWSPLGSGMHHHGVYALATDDAGHVYAGGGFTIAGGAAANYIARWDGSSWSPLGSGMNGFVHALALDNAGHLYAGGWFSTAGGAPANRIAHWDGNSWLPLGSGMDNTVLALALDDAGHLYAGGDFTTAGGTAVNYIARWDGSSWSPLGDGVNDRVRVLALDGASHLYAGGNFTTAGGELSAYLARGLLPASVSYDGNGHTAGDAPLDVAAYVAGDSVTVLDAGTLSRTGHVFTAWNRELDGSGTSYQPGATFTIGPEHVTLYAQWVPTFALSYSAGTGGTIEGVAMQTVVLGSDGTMVTAVPATGYHFVEWSDGSTANPRTDTNVTDDITVTAVFAINQYTLSYSAGPNGAIDGAVTQTVDHGSDGTTVTAVPATDHRFVGWSDGVNDVSRIDTNITAHLTVTANFAIKETPEITAWPTASAITYGEALSASALTDGAASVDGSFAFVDPDAQMNAGTNDNVAVIFTPTDTANYLTVAGSVTVTVNQGLATVSLSGLGHTYDGTPKAVLVSTTPADLAVVVTYDGSETAPVEPGSYAVAATVDDANYQGSAFGTLFIAEHALEVSDGDGGTQGDHTLAVTQRLSFQPTGGSGEYLVTTLANAQGAQGSVVANDDGSYTFVPPRTGAFAGEYLIEVSDLITGEVQQFTVAVPLRVTASRPDLLGKGGTAEITVQGAAPGTLLSLDVLDSSEQEVKDVVASIADASAVDDEPAGHPATTTLFGLDIAEDTQVRVSASAEGYPAGHSGLLTVVAAEWFSGTVTDGAVSLSGATVVADGVTDALYQPHKATTDDNGQFTLAAPKDVQKLAATGPGYAAAVTEAGHCLGESFPCTLQLSMAGMDTLSGASGTALVHSSGQGIALDLPEAPVVIAGIPSFRGSQGGVARVSNVTASGFHLRFARWEYLGGRHTREQIAWMALLPGRYHLPDGSIWEVGRVNVDGTGNFRSRSFGEPFPGTPRLFLTVQTENDNDVVTVRARNVTPEGFRAALFEQESKMDGHATESVGYLAIYNPADRGQVVLNGETVEYTLEGALINHRFREVLEGQHRISLQEEQSLDAEMSHTNEDIDLLLFGEELYGQDVSTRGRDTAALRHR